MSFAFAQIAEIRKGVWSKIRYKPGVEHRKILQDAHVAVIILRFAGVARVCDAVGGGLQEVFPRCLYHAQGSLLERQTQLLIAEQLQYLSKRDGQRLTLMAEDVGGALSGLTDFPRNRVAQTPRDEGRGTGDGPHV
jgi:hypothetical protein